MNTVPKTLYLGVSTEQPIFKYWVKPENYTMSEYYDMTAWLESQLGPSSWGDTNPEYRWSGSNQRYWFKKEADRTLFVIKWS